MLQIESFGVAACLFGAGTQDADGMAAIREILRQHGIEDGRAALEWRIRPCQNDVHLQTFIPAGASAAFAGPKRRLSRES